MTQQTNWKLALFLAVFISGPVHAEDTATGAIKPLSSVRFAPDTDVKCLSSAVETGDPASGRSMLILKASAGCVVPWHFHTAEEQLIIVSGTVLAEMIHYPSARLGPVCRDGGPHAASAHLPRQVRMPDVRHLRSGL